MSSSVSIREEFKTDIFKYRIREGKSWCVPATHRKSSLKMEKNMLKTLSNCMMISFQNHSSHARHAKVALTKGLKHRRFTKYLDPIILK